MAGITGALLGAINIILLQLILLFWCGGIFIPVLIAKFLIPVARWRSACGRLLVRIAELWAHTTMGALRITTGTEWDVRMDATLRREGSYLLLSNHTSWIDIFAVLETLVGRVPFPRFFIKRELIWLPLINVAAWGLDFPFMKRYSPAYLAKHPEKRGADLEATRRACRRFRGVPVSIINYAEGTRFTEAKRDAQGSPYRHLLRPRAGGISFVLAAMEDCLDGVLDMTVIYPDPGATWWNYLCGRVRRIIVVIREIEVPPTAGSTSRDGVRKWLQRVWREKDETVGKMLKS